MSSSPKEKREKIILAVLMSLAAAAGIWYGLLEPQRAALKHKGKLLAETQGKLQMVQRELRLTPGYKTYLETAHRDIQDMEARMPSGDVYRWAIRSLMNVQSNRVDVANVEPPRLGDSIILPKIPYKAAVLSVNGTAYYHDFGTFLASLENSFPHVRLQRLELEPQQFGEASGASQEQLNFKLELVALVKGSSER